jgi:CubicO group peptidase (beta-lactamase class C family)
MTVYWRLSSSILMSLLASCAVAAQHTNPNAGRPQATQISSEQVALNTYLPRLVAEENVPGVVVAAVRGNSITALGAAGVRSTATREVMSPGDLMHVGSLAKPMLATLVGLLVEQGRLQWNSRVLDIFPEWAASVDPAFRELRLDQLLSHRSGVSAFTDGREWNGTPDLNGTDTERRRAFARWLLSRPPQFPEQGFHYSNAGYGVVAAVVEKVTGQDWWTLIQRRLFRPLGMRSAAIGWPYVGGPHQPIGHWWREGRYTPQGPQDPYQIGRILTPAGNIHMTMEDLARFARLHLRGLRGQDGLLRSDTIRRMHQPIAGGNYGFGWYNDSRTFDEPRSRHSGEVGTFHASIWIFPQRDIAIVGGANADNPAAADVTGAAFQRVRLAVMHEAGPNAGR